MPQSAETVKLRFCPSSMNIEMLAVMITTSSDRIKYSLYFVITKIFEVK